MNYIYKTDSKLLEPRPIQLHSTHFRRLIHSMSFNTHENGQLFMQEINRKLNSKRLDPLDSKTVKIKTF